MTFFGRLLQTNPAADLAIALGVFAGVALGLLLLRRLLIGRLGQIAAATETRLDEVLVEGLRTTRRLFLVVLALYLALHTLTLPPRAEKWVEAVMLVALLVQAGLWATGGISLWLDTYVREKRAHDAAAATTVSVAGFVIRLAVWALVLLLVLDNLGFNVHALVASLGIGGIAVALAAQNILGDIFASLSIALDKPFAIGDFIVVGDILGTVEYIGLKTTRIRSLAGEQIVLSNAELLRSRIHNYQRMEERRVLFQFEVVYATTHDKLAQLPDWVREIITAQPATRFDRAHFKAFADSGLVFEVVYYVLDRDYNRYMDIQQDINLELHRRCTDLGIDFAYPTRTIHLRNESTVTG